MWSVLFFGSHSSHRTGRSRLSNVSLRRTFVDFYNFRYAHVWLTYNRYGLKYAFHFETKNKEKKIKRIWRIEVIYYVRLLDMLNSVS